MAFSGVKAGKRGTDFLLLGKTETPGRPFLFRQILSFSDYRATAQPTPFQLFQVKWKTEATQLRGGQWGALTCAGVWGLSTEKFAFLLTALPWRASAQWPAVLSLELCTYLACWDPGKSLDHK